MVETAFDLAKFDAAYPQGIEAHFWNRARNRIILREIGSASAGRKFGRVLKIGCGRGIVLKYLRQHDIDCHGVELSPISVSADLAPYLRTGVDCFALTEAERRVVDCLLLLDVTEHLPEPVLFLSQLRTAFPNARALTVSVPARHELWSNYDDYYGHFRRHTLASLNAELEDAGFHTIDSGYMFKALYPVMLALAKLFRKRATVIAAPHGGVMHRLLGTAFVAEWRLMPKQLWGTSVLATAIPRANP